MNRVGLVYLQDKKKDKCRVCTECYSLWLFRFAQHPLKVFKKARILSFVMIFMVTTFYILLKKTGLFFLPWNATDRRDHEILPRNTPHEFVVLCPHRAYVPIVRLGNIRVYIAHDYANVVHFP